MDDKKQPTLADEMRAEAEIHRRRFVHATRPKGPMTLDEAIALHRRMEGVETREEPCSRI